MSRVLADPLVRTVVSDPLRAIENGGPWDLVILRDGNPTTLRRNRTRTLEFFLRCRARMNPDGILVVRTGVADNHPYWRDDIGMVRTFLAPWLQTDVVADYIDLIERDRERARQALNVH